MPYFSYCAALQLYESLGWWQNTDLTKVHFAQSYGEQVLPPLVMQLWAWVLEAVTHFRAQSGFICAGSACRVSLSLSFPSKQHTHRRRGVEGTQHHLMIMESLGGNGRWFDRFIAQVC